MESLLALAKFNRTDKNLSSAHLEPVWTVVTVDVLPVGNKWPCQGWPCLKFGKSVLIGFRYFTKILKNIWDTRE